MEWVNVFPDICAYGSEEVTKMVYSEDHKDLFIVCPYEYGEEEKEAGGIIQFKGVHSFNNNEYFEYDPANHMDFQGILYERCETSEKMYKKYRFCTAGTDLIIIAKNVKFVEKNIEMRKFYNMYLNRF